MKDLILDGTYGSGELLSEGQVATELGISRTPVREAFLKLRSDGSLELYPERGALVVPVSIGEGRDITQARLLLESFALDALAARGPDAPRRLGDDLAARCGPAATPGTTTTRRSSTGKRSWSRWGSAPALSRAWRASARRR